jgi:hypothetical protein
MKTTTVLAFILGFLGSRNLVAQITVAADSRKWIAYNCQADFSGDSIHLINTSGKTALLWVRNIDFKNGIIELDIRGKNVNGESFVGVAFHGISNEKYDAVYFRPFNFRNQERKDRAVQYVDLPDNDWDMLRERYPGKYEHAIVPDTDPDNWFHAKIVILYPGIKVYVNGSNEPTLEVEQISKRKEGLFGLWVDSEDGWFKNVTVTVDK